MLLRACLLLAGGVFAGSPLPGAELRKDTEQAFRAYVSQVETRIDAQAKGAAPFLWADASPERLAQVRKGGIAVESLSERSGPRIPDGLVHDWIGAVFIPGATLAKTLAFVQDYDQQKNYYRPEVVDSKLLARDGGDFKIHLRLLKKKVLTVVMDTEHDVRYFPMDATRCRSRSYSTRIAEVENAGKPDERVLPPDTGHGFLWRLYSYWRFQERDGGVYVECEAVSLTRDIPTGLGWLIGPIVRGLPRESLTNTLAATRSALVR